MGASVPSDRARFAKFSALVSRAAFLEIPSASKIDRPECSVPALENASSSGGGAPTLPFVGQTD